MEAINHKGGSMIYKLRRNARIKAGAQVAGEVCEEIERKGKLTPKALVDASRPEDAPLHDEFEWDDAIAAEAYREEQAGYIIRSIEVVPEATEHPVRAFVSVTTISEDDEDAPQRPKYEYRSVNTLMRSTEGRNFVLARAMRELASFRLKYLALSELAEVNEAIEKLLTAQVA